MSLDKVAVKVINLEHRKDRKDQAKRELETAGIKDYSFFSAKYIPELGARGCSMSHAKALADYMFYDDKEFVLVFEDDFKFEKDVNFVETLQEILKHSDSWDVFLLAHSQAVAIESTPLKHKTRTANRVIHAHTMSAYIVKRAFVPTLIKCFFESSDYLEKYKGLPSPNREDCKHWVCCDILWKPLQLTHQFWAFLPRCVYQRPSYSDIEKIEVNYLC